MLAGSRTRMSLNRSITSCTSKKTNSLIEEAAEVQMLNREMIVSILVQKGQELLNKPKDGIVGFVRNTKYTQGNEADKLLNDFKIYPHTFVIGCIADKQVDADIAWLTPYNIYS
jgi:hypothetical protein